MLSLVLLYWLDDIDDDSNDVLTLSLSLFDIFFFFFLLVFVVDDDVVDEADDENHLDIVFDIFLDDDGLLVLLLYFWSPKSIINCISSMFNKYFILIFYFYREKK